MTAALLYKALCNKGKVPLDKSIESLLNEIRERLSLLESILPKHIDAVVISPTAKLPYKALLYREALIWRMAELGRAALQSFENDKLASAILLTRATVETSAALWYLCAKLEGTVQSATVVDIDDYLMRLMLGSKTNLDIMPQAINVLNFVDRVDKDIAGFRQQYDMLSEFAHPNWAGTTLLYSKSDPLNLCTDFGANIRGANSTRSIGVLNLSVALMIFERSYNRITSGMPAFVALCENDLKSNGLCDPNGQT